MWPYCTHGVHHGNVSKHTNQFKFFKKQSYSYYNLGTETTKLGMWNREFKLEEIQFVTISHLNWLAHTYQACGQLQQPWQDFSQSTDHLSFSAPLSFLPRSPPSPVSPVSASSSGFPPASTRHPWSTGIVSHRGLRRSV